MPELDLRGLHHTPAITRPILRQGLIQDGPVELWLIITDDRDRLLALAPIDLASLQPEAVGGNLNLTGSTELATLTSGSPGAPLGTATRGWLVMVNQAKGTYARVFPLTLAVPRTLRDGDTTTMDRWEWTIHQAT